MRFEKEYMALDNIHEIRIFNADKDDFYTPAPKEFDIEEVPIKELIKNIPAKIYVLIPFDKGNDFIVQSLASSALEKYSCTREDVRGRLLSKISPLFFDVLRNHLLEVYTKHNSQNLRIVYYNGNDLTKINNIRIVFDMERIFIISNNVDTRFNRDKTVADQGKSSMMETFSKTGSYYNMGGKYRWSQGIYNIINRDKEESDDYYNIVFDLVIPEDKHIVDRIFNRTSRETSQCDETFHIRTAEGTLKDIEVSVYSYFDEKGMIIRQGFIRDITTKSENEIENPIDFLLDGFKNSTKLALLINPLNSRQYNFSKGFYYLIEKDYDEYEHSIKILDNVVEKDVVERIRMLADGKLNTIHESLTYHVDGNPNKKKIVDLYIERFGHDNEVYSIGFLTDFTEEMEKQEQLIESNEIQGILIKEIHHRVKNNLQVIISFLNIEKRFYRNDPDLVIEHMLTRLTSLALLHEKTNNAEDFKKINLNEYLSDHDRKTQMYIDMPEGVEFETSADEELNLTMEVITPFLLIIDELTMNAVKYAFSDDAVTDKKITKKVEIINSDNARLVMSHKGAGINDSKNFGCEIVKSLTKQLDGKISINKDDDGISYVLIFPINMKHTIH